MCLVLFDRAHWHDLQKGYLVADLALCILYFWLAFRSRRYWPLFAASFQLLVILTHLGIVLDPSVRGWAYLTAEIIWSYLVLMTVAYGSWTAPRFRGP
jgi:hypothetical protein